MCDSERGEGDQALGTELTKSLARCNRNRNQKLKQNHKRFGVSLKETVRELEIAVGSLDVDRNRDTN